MQGNGRDIVSSYAQHGLRFVYWPKTGDDKGPKIPDWPKKTYTPDDYHPGLRVGLLTGYELSPGQFLHDVDIDWAPGAKIALQFLPHTDFVFGRASKRFSHCFYTLPEALPTVRFEDVDKTSLIELRGSKIDGDIGFQTMAPPSEWSKGEQHEPLKFLKEHEALPIPSRSSIPALQGAVRLAATGMICAKRFGHNGFGHDSRLAWAGYLLRLGVEPEDLIKMGESISEACNNREVSDVRRVVESTVIALQNNKKAKGGPALARIFGKDGPAILRQINRWFDQDGDFARNDKGIIVKDHYENVVRALTLLNVELTYDEFSDRELVDGKHTLDDHWINNLWFQIDQTFKFRPTDAFFFKVIDKIAHDNNFHPVRDYFDGLQWDGIARLDRWLIDFAGAIDTTYTRFVSSIPLIAAVRRIRQPGVKYDEMLVLEGEQGINKSSALRALCPNPDWFCDDLPLNVDSKRLIETTLGKMIVESSDLAGRNQADIEHLKAMLSRQRDGPVRMAYGRKSIERDRQFIIIGTTNTSDYLRDMTGARRMWPVPIKQFDVAAVTTYRDQIWAEAVAREASGESIRLPEELWPIAAGEQDKRREVDPWEERIRESLLAIIPSPDGSRRVATSLLFDRLEIDIERRDRVCERRLSSIMQHLGGQRIKVRLDGVVTSGYIVKDSKRLELQEEIEESGEIKDEAPF